MTYFRVPRVCDFDLMLIINSRIHERDLNVKIVPGVTLHPQYLQVCYPHKIEVADTKITEFSCI